MESRIHVKLDLNLTKIKKMSKIYHSNGNLAYDPDQDYPCVYHSNGNLAYDPYPDYPKVYHSNGNLAYDPYSSDPEVFHSNGDLAYEGTSLELELGEGIKWNYNNGQWTLYAYEQCLYSK